MEFNVRKEWNKVHGQRVDDNYAEQDLRGFVRDKSNPVHSMLLKSLSKKCDNFSKNNEQALSDELMSKITYSQNGVNEVNKFGYLLNVNSKMISPAGDKYVALSVPFESADNGYGIILLPKERVHKTLSKSRLGVIYTDDKFVDIDLGGLHDDHTVKYVANGKNCTAKYRNDRCMKWFNLSNVAYSFGKRMVLSKDNLKSYNKSQDILFLTEMVANVVKDNNYDMFNYDVKDFNLKLKDAIDDFVDKKGIVGTGKAIISYGEEFQRKYCENYTGFTALSYERTKAGKCFEDDEDLRMAIGGKENKSLVLCSSMKDGVKDGLYMTARALAYGMYPPDKSIFDKEFDSLTKNEAAIVIDMTSLHLAEFGESSRKYSWICYPTNFDEFSEFCHMVRKDMGYSQLDSPYYDARIDVNVESRTQNTNESPSDGMMSIFTGFDDISPFN